ncbi:MAG: DegT/DnrJ/EryC1/StrS family aminotransferase [Deltaproteobacteria bacterium]|nr:DegT/DnrJ/EryC1/StrS family aminotransferase [Deltaproteobacteria bacterium]
MTQVPLLDLKKQHQRIRGRIARAIDQVLESQIFIQGPVVEAFEREIAEFCRVPYGVGVNSGTDALLLALMALGVKPGDRVVTTPYSFFSTVGVISRLGARPLFVDIDPHTYNLDPQRLEELLGKKAGRKKPKVLLPVHLFGQMAEMEALRQIAGRFELAIVEDAAQALGARQRIPRNSRKEWMAGSVGDLGCFSFYPSKNLGALGDGGMVVTRHSELAEKVRILRDHGMKPRYHHRLIGINSRLDALQAAVLRVKLGLLPVWTEARRRNAGRYRSLFQESGLLEAILPREQAGCYHIFNQFVIRVGSREALRAHLRAEGIGTEVYYPVPLHLQECYRPLGYRPGDFPQAEQAARETLALPVYPELTLGQQRKVVRAIKKFYRQERT